jgi:hypothetical protein
MQQWQLIICVIAIVVQHNNIITTQIVIQHALVVHISHILVLIAWYVQIYVQLVMDWLQTVHHVMIVIIITIHA